MTRTKFKATIAIPVLCLSLLISTWPPNTSAETARTAELFDAGELIEAPADGTVYVSLGGVGSALLASGAKARLTTLNDSALVASVVSGDLIVKLQPQSRAYVKAGETIFSTARGALFHAGLRNGKAFVDASDDLRDRVPDLGNWAISVPRMESSRPAEAPREALSQPASKPAARQLNFAASARPIGRVESLGLVKINQNAAVRGGFLWGSELIQAPEGSSARATLDGIAQVVLTGGSQARLTTLAVGSTTGSRVLAASLVSGGVVVHLNPSIAGYAEAAGATFLAARGARFRAMLVEGRAVFETIEGVGFEKGEWALASPQPLSELIRSITQQQPATQAARRYIVRPVGLNSNLVVRARSARQIQVRVTDEDDRPVKGLPIIFLLNSSGGSSVGSLGTVASASSTARVFTNDEGVAEVSFIAADAATTGTISATVEGTNYSWVGQINLIKVSVGFWSTQNAVPVLAAAAAAAVAGTVKEITKEDKLPIKAGGTTIIKP